MNEERITQFEMAQRELLESIRLFFEDRDPVSYYLLAFSSHEIIEKIAIDSKLDSLSDGVNSLIKNRFMGDPETVVRFEKFFEALSGNDYPRKKKRKLKDKIDFVIKSNYNELKHWKGKGNDEIIIHWDVAQLIIFDSIDLLKKLGIKLTAEHIAMSLWLSKTMPDLFSKNPRSLTALGVFENAYGVINTRKDGLSFIANFHNSIFGVTNNAVT